MKNQRIINEGIKNIYEGVSQLNQDVLLESLADEGIEMLSSPELQCIQLIGSNKDVNVTFLSEQISMTTSAISKVIRKLEKKSLINRYQKADNRKEIYFSLTESGKKVYAFHESMTQKFVERDASVYAVFGEDELQTIVKFVTLYQNHLSKLMKERQ